MAHVADTSWFITCYVRKLQAERMHGQTCEQDCCTDNTCPLHVALEWVQLDAKF